MPLPGPHLRPRKSEFLGMESGQVGFMGPQRVVSWDPALTRV